MDRVDSACPHYREQGLRGRQDTTVVDNDGRGQDSPR